MRGDRHSGAWRLDGEELSGLDLSGADLEHAGLWQAELGGTRLAGANLKGADLRDANLRGANLDAANLEGANLQGAHLDDATLLRASVRDADLSHARLGGCQLSGLDVSESCWEGVRVPFEQWRAVRGRARVAPVIVGRWTARRTSLAAAAAAAIIIGIFYGPRLLDVASPRQLAMTTAGTLGTMGEAAGDGAVEGAEKPTAENGALAVEFNLDQIRGDFADVQIQIRGGDQVLYECRFEEAIPRRDGHSTASLRLKDVSCGDFPALQRVEISAESMSIELPRWKDVASSAGVDVEPLVGCALHPDLAVHVAVRPRAEGCAGNPPVFDATDQLCLQTSAERDWLQVARSVWQAAGAASGGEQLSEEQIVLLADALVHVRDPTSVLSREQLGELCGLWQALPSGPGAVVCAHYHRLVQRSKFAAPLQYSESEFIDSLYNLAGLGHEALFLHATDVDGSRAFSPIADQIVARLNPLQPPPHTGALSDAWHLYIVLINSARGAETSHGFSAPPVGAGLESISDLTVDNWSNVSSLEWERLARQELDAARSTEPSNPDTQRRNAEASFLLNVNAAYSHLAFQQFGDATEAVRLALQDVAEILELDSPVDSVTSRKSTPSKFSRDESSYTLQLLGFGAAASLEAGAPTAFDVGSLLDEFCRLFPRFEECAAERDSRRKLVDLMSELYESIPRDDSTFRKRRSLLAFSANPAWHWARFTADGPLLSRTNDEIAWLWDSFEGDASHHTGAGTHSDWYAKLQLLPLWRILGKQVTEAGFAPEGVPTAMDEYVWHELVDPIPWLQTAERVRTRRRSRARCTLQEAKRAAQRLRGEARAGSATAAMTDCASLTPLKPPDWERLQAAIRLDTDLVYFWEDPFEDRMAIVRWPMSGRAQIAWVATEVSLRERLDSWSSSLAYAADRARDPFDAWNHAVPEATRAHLEALFGPVATERADVPRLLVVSAKPVEGIAWHALPVGPQHQPLLLTRDVVEAPDLASALEPPPGRPVRGDGHLFVADPVHFQASSGLEADLTTIGLSLTYIDDSESVHELLSDSNRRARTAVVVGHHLDATFEPDGLLGILPLERWAEEAVEISDTFRLSDSLVRAIGDRAELTVLMSCSTSTVMGAESATQPPMAESLGATLFRHTSGAVLGFRSDIPNDESAPLVPLVLAGATESTNLAHLYGEAVRELYRRWESAESFGGAVVEAFHWGAPYLYARI